MLFLPLIAFVICFVFVYVYLIKPTRYWKQLNVPHVKTWIFFGNMGSFILRQKCLAEMVQDVYNAYDLRYIGFNMFTKPTLMIKDLNLLKQIGIKDFDHFVNHRTLINTDIDPLFGKNLFSLKGQQWRHMRSALSPAFTGSKMRAMFVLISECSEQFTDYYTKILDQNKPTTLEMKDIFTRFANDVIASTAFGFKCDSLRDKENEFYMMGKDATNFSGMRVLKFFGYSISPILMKLFRVQLFNPDTGEFFKNLVKNNIAMRECKGIVRPDMIHLLMEARKGKLKHEDSSKKSEDGAGFATVEESHIGKQDYQTVEELSDDDITAQALIFFFAGFDSVSGVLCHTVYELALNEDTQVKLQEEIDITLKECNGKFNYEAVIKMKYLDMVVSESLRKWPPSVAMDRVCTSDGYTIQAEHPNEVPVRLKRDDPIWIPIYALHRDPKYFPNPDKFDPERFSDENKHNIVPFSYLPFGIGPRNCIGSRFALLEVKIILFHVLSKISFVIVEKSEIPLKISRTQFNMNAENGFWLGLKLRNK